jgi:hypothetical protein
MKIISLIFVIILFYCAEPVSRISSAQPSNLKTANTTSLYPIEKLNDGRFRMSSEILVLGTPRIVEIIYQQGSEGFASYHLEYAVKFIPKIADYFQIAPTQTVFRITQLTDGSTDRNEGTSVFFHLENQFSETKGLPTGHPLLFHEIGHWWFGQNPRFIAEGVSSFLPIAIMNEGLINFDKKEINDIYSWWGFYNPKIVDDVPLGDNEYKEKTGYPGFSLNYEKSFKIQYIIYNELGKDKYKIFLKSLLDYQNINENWVKSSRIFKYHWNFFCFK